MALWEESGGHTFNLLNINNSGGSPVIQSILPPIGDKYPAPALLLLATLIEKGFDLKSAINQEILGLRTKIPASDKQKVAIVEHFSHPAEKSITIDNKTYEIHSFEQINGKIAIIHLKSNNSNLYFRPSGTGPGVRIYIFGEINTAKNELMQVKAYFINLFDLKK